MLRIQIETTPHKDQKYNTVGSYNEREGKWNIVVSDMGNWKYEFLVAIHEMVEESLCLDRGINIEEGVIGFDKKFQKLRSSDKPTEPGTVPQAPYHKEHGVATSIEKQMAKELGVDWNEYNRYIDGLYSKSIVEKTFQ